MTAVLIILVIIAIILLISFIQSEKENKAHAVIGKIKSLNNVITNHILKHQHETDPVIVRANNVVIFDYAEKLVYLLAEAKQSDVNMALFTEDEIRSIAATLKTHETMSKIDPDFMRR